MVIVIYILIVLASATQSVTTKLYNRVSSSSSVFNAIKAYSSLALLALITIFGFEFHLPTVLFGCCYGVCLCISMFTGYQALCHGPMALTSMLVSFSVVIPLIWGITVGNETIKIIQYPALVLLLLAIVITNLDKLKVKERKATKYGLWLFFVGATFLCNGICSVLQKQYQTLYPNAHNKEFVLFAMLFCSVVYTIFALIKTSFKELKLIKGKHFAVLSGVANGAVTFLTLVLAGLENASIMFPIISAGTIFAALICGRLIFKEKLKINHYIALVLGITATILLKI